MDLVGGVIALIQLADRVITISSKIIEGVKDAPRDILVISTEVASLKNILLTLQTTPAASTLFFPNGPMQLTESCLKELCDLLPSGANAERLSEIPSMRMTFTTLAWPLKESKARRLLAEIALHKSTMLLSVAGHMA